jgi:elongation factor G
MAGVIEVSQNHQNKAVSGRTAVTSKEPADPRCAALVGPYLAGKTSLLESILLQTGAIGRRGSAKDGNTAGDASAEARARQMSTEINVATTEYLGETWTFLDCPGSIELCQEAYNALMVVDTAVVVCEPEPQKALTLAPLLRFLDERSIPHIVFINKMDLGQGGVRETLDALQAQSARPLVLREVPIRDGERIAGFVDLVSERAFRWEEGKRSELIEVPQVAAERTDEARVAMLEALADFDDGLLEQLLEDVVPSPQDIYAGMARDLQQDLIVPVFFGSAEASHGITRLLKALRHEAPVPGASAQRLGFTGGGEATARVFKTVHAPHAGKLSYVRIWSGEIADGMTLNGDRVSGVNRALGVKLEKVAKAGTGEVVALGRLDSAATGAVLSPSGNAVGGPWPEPLTPLFALAVQPAQRQDEVKLTGALARLTDEDPSLSFGHDPDTGELLLWGQGEMQIAIALDRLRNRFNIEIASHAPLVPYKETIRAGVSQHARHKKQTGGHGEFGDVHLDIAPLQRGEGFRFAEKITGGAVPKQYIPAVEAGVREYLARGPLGFPVVDLEVTLTDGQYHTVDSSDMAFRKAAQAAMKEGMAKCSPVLLEPIFEVRIAVPSDFMSRIQRIVSARRGQMLGFEAKADWTGWDEVAVLLPQAEMHGLIIDLRSVTLGVGTFAWRFDHLQELVGRLADDVVAHHAQQAG